MSIQNDCYQDFLEWEVVDENAEITNIKFENQHYEVNEDAVIKFHRNSRFRLIATMTKISIPHQLHKDHGDLGSFIEKENITGMSKDKKIHYKLSGIVMGGVRQKNNLEDNFTTYQANIIFDSIEKTYVSSISEEIEIETPTETETLCEWYLCGNPSFTFPRSTKRKVEKKYVRARVSIDKEEAIEKAHSYKGTNDYLYVKNENVSFIVAKVPDQYGPDWSSKLVIEYRKSFGKIPDNEVREAISELVSFIYGNQLIKVGESEFDNRQFFTKQLFQNSFSKDAISICQSSSFTPISVQSFDERVNIENVISNLLNPYLNQRNELLLGGAISKFWLAKSSELGANLPILSSAVESLSEKYLESHPVLNPYYIKYDHFTTLIESELLSISEKLKDNEFRDIILKKIKDTSQRSLKNKIDQMFEQLKLSIGTVERKAINARHKMAHTSFNEIEDEEVKKLIRLTRAYETLFHRIVLKILGYEGEYIDYYTIGFPKRDIDEFIPESSG